MTKSLRKCVKFLNYKVDFLISKWDAGLADRN